MPFGEHCTELGLPFWPLNQTLVHVNQRHLTYKLHIKSIKSQAGHFPELQHLMKHFKVKPIYLQQKAQRLLEPNLFIETLEITLTQHYQRICARGRGSYPLIDARSIAYLWLVMRHCFGHRCCDFYLFIVFPSTSNRLLCLMLLF